jgi:formate dehydrogenase subunit delta
MLPEVETDHKTMVEMKIIRMSNQIATYFASRPQGERAAGIASHINDFWEPRMRSQLLALLAERGDAFKADVVASMPLIRKPSR